MRLQGACCTAAVLVLLAGCGSSDSDSSDGVDPSSDAPSGGDSSGTDSPDTGASGSGSSGTGSPDTGSPDTGSSDSGTPDAGSPGGGEPGSGGEGGGATSGDAPVISSDSYETILREVIAIADDRVLDAASESVDPLIASLRSLYVQARESGAASGDGLVFVSDEARGGESERAVTFSCGDGGTLVVEASVYDDLENSPLVSGFSAGEGCAIGGDLYAGRVFKLVRIVRGTDVENFEGFSVTRADGDSLALDGDYSDSAPEGRGPGVDTGWSDADLLVVEDGETTRIDGLESLRSSSTFTGPGATPGATTGAAFSVTAPWSSNERLDVTVDLGFDWEDTDAAREEGRITGQQWQRGTLRVVAPDGSALTLTPETGDPATLSVTIDGEGGEPIVREWSDGFQLNCPEPFVCG